MEEGRLTNDDILQQNVPWETYKTAKLISDRDYALIKRFDKSTDTAKASALEDSSSSVFEALFTVLRNVTQPDTVRYTLVLIDEIIMMEPARAKEMHEPSSSHLGAGQPNAALVLCRLLSRTDWFTQEKAAKLLSIAIASAPETDPSVVTQFLEWLTSQLRQPSAGDASIEAAATSLAGLLRARDVRGQFANSVHLLERVLKNTVAGASPQRSQILYTVTLCLWQLSFCEAAMQTILGSGVVQPLVDLLKEGNKEKVMRISLMTLTRLAAAESEAVLAAMVDAGLPRLVKIRSAQSWADEDIPDLLEGLDESLASCVQELSKFEKYRQEVLSGNLEWTPMHTNVAFWQEHLSVLEEKDFQLVRCLIRLLENSRDVKVLAIACSDLGMFAEAHPHGRYIINDLDGKSKVMAQMNNPDSDVQKHALLCVQRLMLGRDKLDFLRKPASLTV